MWTEAHRARHDARLKEIVSLNAVGQVARWLERADPPRSGRATPYGAVKWLEQGLFDRLLADVARRRRRAMGRRARPRLSILDTQAVQCIPVRGPRGV